MIDENLNLNHSVCALGADSRYKDTESGVKMTTDILLGALERRLRDAEEVRDQLSSALSVRDAQLKAAESRAEGMVMVPRDDMEIAMLAARADGTEVYERLLTKWLSARERKE